MRLKSSSWVRVSNSSRPPHPSPSSLRVFSLSNKGKTILSSSLFSFKDVNMFGEGGLVDGFWPVLCVSVEGWRLLQFILILEL